MQFISLLDQTKLVCGSSLAQGLSVCKLWSKQSEKKKKFFSVHFLSDFVPIILSFIYWFFQARQEDDRLID